MMTQGMLHKINSMAELSDVELMRQYNQLCENRFHVWDDVEPEEYYLNLEYMVQDMDESLDAYEAVLHARNIIPLV